MSLTNERPLYRDREEAAAALVPLLNSLVQQPHDLLVLGMPRGGVLVARAVADALGAPLDAIVARKLGVPGLSEVALGAIVEGHKTVVADRVARYLGVPRRLTARIAERERREIARRVQAFRGGRPLPDVRGRTALVVDDGLATGATICAAVAALRAMRPKRIIVACPVGSAAGCEEVRAVADDLVVPATPEPFDMVSRWYEHFSPVGDREVQRALSCITPTSVQSSVPEKTEEREVTISLAAGDGALVGDVGLPEEWLARGETPVGLVVFAHGGGSSRQSYRNRFLAGWLRMEGWATLRVDLLTASEQESDAMNAAHRFDVERIGERLQCAIDWAVGERIPGSANVVLFGASTGAAAAVLAAVERPDVVTAVIARGGRVDLAREALTKLRVPILMIVGGADEATLRWNRDAILRLRGDVTFKVVRGAGHTFDEHGAIGAVGALVSTWLGRRALALNGTRASWWRALATRLRRDVASAVRGQ